MIKTSVVIPVYNTSKYVEKCIESVFCQTQKEIEVIAINDGSTDNSYDVLVKMQERYPDLIVLSQDNHGLGYTRNVGLKRAKGKYVYFLDSDDYILENTLDVCYQYAEENQLDMLLFDALAFKDTTEGRIMYPEEYDRHEMSKEWSGVCSGADFIKACYQRRIYHPVVGGVYCSLKFLNKNNILFLPRVYFEDNEFHCRTMMLADRVMYIPERFYQKRCLNTSIMGTDFNLRKARDYLTVINAITDLRELNRIKWHQYIKKINLNLLNDLAHEIYSNRLYRQDVGLVLGILRTWVRMVW